MSTPTEFLEDATRQLITAGVILVRHIQDRATTTPDSDLDRASKAFERVARGTRRAILIADKLTRQQAVRIAARKQIIRTVEDTIQREAADEYEEAALEAEFHDRLDAPDLEDDIAARPTPEIIADIVRDLGLVTATGAHPWKRRTPAEIAQLAARAAAPPGPTTRHAATTTQPPRHFAQGHSG